MGLMISRLSNHGQDGGSGRVGARTPTLRWGLAALLVVMLAFAAACSIRRKEVTEANAAEVVAAVAEGHDLTPEEADLFRTYLVRHALNATSAPLPATVATAIDRQRAFRQELAAREQAERDAAQRAEQQRRAQVEQLRSEVGVQITAIEFVPSDAMRGRFEALLRFRVNVANRSSRGIHGVRGSVAFLDTFGREVAQIGMPIEQDVAAGTAADLEMNKRFNQFVDTDVAIRNFDMSRGRMEWRPEQIVYADGTQVAVPEAL